MTNASPWRTGRDGHAGRVQEAEAATRIALASADDTAVLAAAPFDRIAGSLSNFAWHVSVPGQDCFVRYARAGSELLGADLRAESEILRLVADAGIAPRVVRCDPPARLLVTQWIASADSNAAPLAQERMISRVAATLCRLHQLTPPPGVRAVDFAVQARQLEAALPAAAARPASPPVPRRSCRNSARRVRRRCAITTSTRRTWCSIPLGDCGCRLGVRRVG